MCSFRHRDLTRDQLINAAEAAGSPFGQVGGRVVDLPHHEQGATSLRAPTRARAARVPYVLSASLQVRLAKYA